MTGETATYAGLGALYEQLADLVQNSDGVIALGMPGLPGPQIDTCVRELRALAERHKTGRTAPDDN